MLQKMVRSQRHSRMPIQVRQCLLDVYYTDADSFDFIQKKGLSQREMLFTYPIIPRIILMHTRFCY